MDHTSLVAVPLIPHALDELSRVSDWSEDLVVAGRLLRTLKVSVDVVELVETLTEKDRFEVMDPETDIATDVLELAMVGSRPCRI